MPNSKPTTSVRNGGKRKKKQDSLVVPVNKNMKMEELDNAMDIENEPSNKINVAEMNAPLRADIEMNDPNEINPPDEIRNERDPLNEHNVMAGNEPNEMAGNEPNEMAGNEPNEMAGNEPNEMAGNEPNEMAGNEGGVFDMVRDLAAGNVEKLNENEDVLNKNEENLNENEGDLNKIEENFKENEEVLKENEEKHNENEGALNKNEEKPEKNEENPRENENVLNKNEVNPKEHEDASNKNEENHNEHENALNKNEEGLGEMDNELKGNEEDLNGNEEDLNGNEEDLNGNEEDLNGNKLIESNDRKYLEYYLNKGYCIRNNGKEQYYARDGGKNEIYFTDPTNEEIYASKIVTIGNSEQLCEFPAVSQDGKPNYIYDRGIPRYPENLTTSSVILPRDPETNQEYYLPNLDGSVNYPRNKFGKAFYRTDSNGDEVPLSDYKYATNSDGSEIYPKLKNGDEYYLKVEGSNSEVGAMMIFNGEMVPYYARKKNDDEIYPRVWL